MLTEEAHLGDDGPGFGGMTLAYHVRQREDVETVLAEARDAGATILKPAEDTDWGEVIPGMSPIRMAIRGKLPGIPSGTCVRMGA